MHPNKKEGVIGHNAKLRRMTAHYGDADPAMKKLAPVDEVKKEGSEEDVGYGADSSAAKARGDKPARRTAAANPVSTYKRGGSVKAKRRAEGGDVSAIEMANRNQSQSRARGGRTKHKGTHVNVIVAPQGGGAPAPAGLPVPPPMPPKPPMAAAPPGGPAGLPAPPMGAGPMLAGAPGGLPPGMVPPRARGGRLVSQKHHMTAGAVTGEGRLEKIGKKPKDAGRPQAV